MQYPDDIIIRPAGRDDVPAIVALLADDALGRGREDLSDPPPEAYFRAFEAIAAQPGNFVFVAEIDGTVVGCLQLTVIPGLSRRGTARGLIEGVRVASDRRSQGIGERLVRDAVGRARAAGCGLVELTSDKSRLAAHRFYERLGFHASHVGMKLLLD